MLQIDNKWVAHLFEELKEEEIQLFETITDKISKRAKGYDN
jgi:hypothetical protein